MGVHVGAGNETVPEEDRNKGRLRNGRPESGEGMSWENGREEKERWRGEGGDMWELGWSCRLPFAASLLQPRTGIRAEISDPLKILSI